MLAVASLECCLEPGKTWISNLTEFREGFQRFINRWSLFLGEIGPQFYFLVLLLVSWFFRCQDFFFSASRLYHFQVSGIAFSLMGWKVYLCIYMCRRMPSLGFELPKSVMLYGLSQPGTPKNFLLRWDLTVSSRFCKAYLEDSLDLVILIFLHKSIFDCTCNLCYGHSNIRALWMLASCNFNLHRKLLKFLGF